MALLLSSLPAFPCILSRKAHWVVPRSKRQHGHLPSVVAAILLHAAVRLHVGVPLVAALLAVVLEEWSASLLQQQGQRSITYVVVHLHGVLLGLVLGPLAVEHVFTLCLGELVDLSTGKASEELLGELVGNGLACG